MGRAAAETRERYRRGDPGVKRRNAVVQSLDAAMVELRAAEDFARLDLEDDVLAGRIREVIDSLTEDVMEGQAYRHSARWRARCWDRYCLMRRRDSHGTAAWHLTWARRFSRPRG